MGATRLRSHTRDSGTSTAIHAVARIGVGGGPGAMDMPSAMLETVFAAHDPGQAFEVFAIQDTSEFLTKGYRVGRKMAAAFSHEA